MMMTDVKRAGPIRTAGVVAAVLLLAFALGAGKRPQGLGDVTEIRVHEHGDHTRVVIELSRTARYETGFVDDPPRMYVDIADTWIEKAVRPPTIPDSPRVLRGKRVGGFVI